MKNPRNWIVGLVAAFILSIPAYIGIYRSTEDVEIITITEKERVQKSDSSYYLVWTKEGEVFCVDDSISFWTFDSSDRYGQLKSGNTYLVRIAGWRVQFLSMYRNIITIREELKAKD